MYKRNAQGWLKHMDFILWDLMILQVSFVLGYMIRFGWGEWPYSTLVYKSLAVVLTAVDFLIIVLFNTLHNVMKRGFLKELTSVFQQSALILAIMSESPTFLSVMSRMASSSSSGSVPTSIPAFS